MVNVRTIAASLAASSLIGAVVAHPGDSAEVVKHEKAMHKHAQVAARHAINAWATSSVATSLKARSAARRTATVQALREKRGITEKSLKNKRDQTALEHYLNVSHDTTEGGFTMETPLDVIFDSNSTAALVPEVTIGPYWVGGEFIRTDITDGQAGVPLHLDLQFIELNTLKPVPNMLIDIWACNATGKYSGIGNGQGSLNATHGRGVQITDQDGVVQFDTIFPGHYVGRTPHIHVMSTENATVLPNKTYLTDGKPNHIGQLFFDQSLINAVEETEPYNSNTQALTLNSDDGIDAQQSTDEYDPFADYVLLGNELQDGLLAYLTVFVDTTANQTAKAIEAAHYYESGGVAVSRGGSPGGTGMPTGFPTGFPTSSPIASGSLGRRGSPPPPPPPKPTDPSGPVAPSPPVKPSEPAPKPSGP
ncbi:aromatic compound dioxygenase [Hypoxylon sp. FL1284]|nr:aromatic compound dioxygenase [Hypoxylon sp. FL1284]